MTPLSTYRLQLNRDFDLPAATRLVPYVRALGVDWLYLSPIFAAQIFDGRPLAELGVDSYTRVELRPGRHTLAAPDRPIKLEISCSVRSIARSALVRTA